MDDYQPDVVGLLKRVYPFRALEDSDLTWIAEAGEILQFAPGQDFYDQGQPAEYFYFILDGEVNLNYNTGKMNTSMGLYKDDDQFGFEVFDQKGLYLTSAFAVSEGALFRLHRETIQVILHTIPDLTLPLQMQAHSLQLSLEVYLDWRKPEEMVFYIDRRHPYFMWARLFLPVIAFAASITVLGYLALANLPGTLLPGFIAGAVGLISGLWLIWNYVDWSNDYSIITDQRANFQERVVLLYDSREESPLTAIQSSKVESSQTGRIIGYGDLILKTFTGTLAFPDIRHPEVVANLLEDRRKRAEIVGHRVDMRKLRREIRQRLKFVEPPEKTAPIVKQLQPGSLSQVLANLFRMRWEQNGVITYRKHWFILLRKIFLPGLILLAWLTFVILDLFKVIPLLDVQAGLGLGFVGLLILGFWNWYVYADWSNDIYIVSDDQFTDIYKKPLGSEEKQSAPIKNIQSVEFERLGFLGLVLNYGTVFIRVGDARYTFDTIYDPSDCSRDIFQRIAKSKNMEKKRQEDDARARMIEAIEAYHAVVGDPYERTEKDEVRRIDNTRPSK